MSDQLLWAPRAWVDGRWQDAVLLRIGADGHWAEVQAGSSAPPQAQRLASAVLPGLVDAHSHAFQRAFAGLAERRDSEHDDFWSWRDGMYRVALRITPAQLRAVAAQLYAELLQGGYTQVCEFHYLQHDLDGQPYPDPLELSWALADAAEDTGIGLTLLPVLYQRAGFAAANLRDDQRRFATDAASRSIRCVQRNRRRCGGSLIPSETRRSTSMWPNRPPRSTTAWLPPASARSNGCARSTRSTHAGSWCTPPTRSHRKSTRWRAAAPASSSARRPKPTSATA
jgi:formimidoylglutamate deiminase